MRPAAPPIHGFGAAGGWPAPHPGAAALRAENWTEAKPAAQKKETQSSRVRVASLVCVPTWPGVRVFRARCGRHRLVRLSPSRAGLPTPSGGRAAPTGLKAGSIRMFFSGLGGGAERLAGPPSDPPPAALPDTPQAAATRRGSTPAPLIFAACRPPPPGVGPAGKTRPGPTADRVGPLGCRPTHAGGALPRPHGAKTPRRADLRPHPLDPPGLPARKCYLTPRKSDLSL